MKSQEVINGLIIRAGTGDSYAQNTLAIAYYTGDGVGKDAAKAMAWYEISAAAGNMYAQSNLAYRYRHGTDGYEKNLGKAFELYLKSAMQGLASSQESLGVFYDFGYGTTKDAVKAVEWYQKAASQGLKLAQNNLGSLYEHGDGVEQDLRKAFKWYSKSAAQGYEYAQCNLGILYEEGIGVKRDLNKALYWYKKSAAQGHERASKRLQTLSDAYDENTNSRIYTFPYFINNPYRILGVYSNSSAREIAANKSKATAFAKINKTISFQTDKLLLGCYHPIYNTQPSLFEDDQTPSSADVVSDATVNDIYIEIRKCLKLLNSLFSTRYYANYDQNIEEELNKHNILLNRISALRDELQSLQDEYERKVKGLLTPSHTLEAMDVASADLAQSIDKIKFSLFWFINKTDADKKALNLIENGQTQEAIEVWEKEENVSSIFNRALTAFIIEEDDETYVQNITKIIHDDIYRTEFVKLVCDDTYNITEEEFAHLFIDILLDKLPDEDWKRIFHENGESADDDDYVCSSLAIAPTQILLEKVAEVSKISRDNGLARYNGAQSLMDVANEKLSILSDLVGKDNIHYQQIADKVAREILNCAFDYYKAYNNIIYTVTQECVDLNQYAYDIAVGSTLKERLQDNLTQIKDRLAQMPPKTVFDLFRTIEKLLSDFSKEMSPKKPASVPITDLFAQARLKANGSSDLTYSEKLISDCAPLIREIKNSLDDDDKSYIALSTAIVAYSLSNVIKVLNQKLEGPDWGTYLHQEDTLKGSLKRAWQIFINMDLFAMEQDFRMKRYIPNRDIVEKHLKSFQIPTHISPTIDLRSENESYNACSTISGCNEYLKIYPSGKYREEVQKKRDAMKNADDTCWNACVNSGNYKSYLKACPNGIHTDEASRKASQKTRRLIIISVVIAIVSFITATVIWRAEGAAVLLGIFTFLSLVGAINNRKNVDTATVYFSLMVICAGACSMTLIL